MSKELIVRGSFIIALLLLCLVAGIIGGLDFAPDVMLIRHFQAVRADWPGLTVATIAITQAGNAFGTVGGGLGVTFWLIWRRQRWLAAVLRTTVLGERLVVDGLKLLIERTRPTFDLHPVATHSSSFPSGHAANSMAVFLSIALIAVPRAQRLSAVVTAVVASLIIGGTRPYLGVHWPSDVIGGWSLGAAIAIIAWSTANARGSESDRLTSN